MDVEVYIAKYITGIIPQMSVGCRLDDPLDVEKNYMRDYPADVGSLEGINYLTYVGSSPSEPMQTVFGTLCHLMHIICCTKSNLDRSTGFGLWDVGKNACFSLKANSSLTVFNAAALTVNCC